MYLAFAGVWSLATAWTIATGGVTFFAVAAVVVAVLAIVIAVSMQFREEGDYRASHMIAR